MCSRVESFFVVECCLVELGGSVRDYRVLFVGIRLVCSLGVESSSGFAPIRVGELVGMASCIVSVNI